ncbi:MAG: ribonuclease D [Lysobacterales bacterium]|jgi:ribonuclease D
MQRTTLNNALSAAEHPILLTSEAQLRDAERAWADAAILGIDTEFVRERTYRAELGLVQISDGETAWLYDPQAFEDAAPLTRLLEDDSCLKVLHSGSEDLEVLLHSVSALPDPLVDTQIACAMLGQPLQLAYHGAVKWLFDVEIEKDQTRSNWCRRPLTDNQLRYAAMDVVLLPDMCSLLRDRLQKEGRWSWLEEDVARLQRGALVPVDPELAYLRIGGAPRLDDAGLATLQALAEWRERTAAERNRARGFVISDAGLMQLAREKPSSARQLESLDQVHPGARRRYGADLLQLIARSRSSQGSVVMPEPLDGRQQKILKRMKDIVARQARSLGIEAALLASRKELEKLVRSAAAGEPPPERFLGWRKEVITDELLAVIG